MRYEYNTNGTCSTHIAFELQNGVVSDIEFTGGCSGNLKALSILLEGRPAQEIVEKLSGNICGSKPTSCADQLARAVAQAGRMEKEKER